MNEMRSMIFFWLRVSNKPFMTLLSEIVWEHTNRNVNKNSGIVQGSLLPSDLPI